MERIKENLSLVIVIAVLFAVIGFVGGIVVQNGQTEDLVQAKVYEAVSDKDEELSNKYDEGYADGLNDGLNPDEKAKFIETAYNDGYSDGKSSVTYESISEGAYEDGYEDGCSDCYNDAYEEGFSDAETFYNIATDRTRADVTYVANTNTGKFHEPFCDSAHQTKEENRQYFYGNREEVINAGFTPCSNCKP